MGLKPWPPTCAGEATHSWPRCQHPRHVKVTSWSSAPQPRDVTRRRVTDRLWKNAGSLSPPLGAASLPPLGLFLAAAAAYIRSEADGREAARPSPKLRRRHVPPPPSTGELGPPPFQSSQPQPGSKERAGESRGGGTWVWGSGERGGEVKPQDLGTLEQEWEVRGESKLAAAGRSPGP